MDMGWLQVYRLFTLWSCGWLQAVAPGTAQHHRRVSYLTSPAGKIENFKIWIMASTEYILLFFNWQIIYNIVMTSAIHQQESAIGIHVSPASWTPLALPSLPHLSRLSQSTGFGFPASYFKLPLAIYFTYGNKYVSMLFSQIKSHPLLLPLCPKVFSLCLCCLCCPAHKLISTIFLDPIYMHLYMIFIFLFLTYFTLCNRL